MSIILSKNTTQIIMYIFYINNVFFRVIINTQHFLGKCYLALAYTNTSVRKRNHK